MLAEDVAFNDLSFGGLCEVRHAFGQDRVAVVGLAILGEEADEALWFVRRLLDCVWMLGLTENAGMLVMKFFSYLTMVKG